MFKAKGVDLKEADNEVRKELPSALKEHMITTMARRCGERPGLRITGNP